jgi:hypothetical protein
MVYVVCTIELLTIPNDRKIGQSYKQFDCVQLNECGESPKHIDPNLKTLTLRTV